MVSKPSFKVQWGSDDIQLGVYPLSDDAMIRRGPGPWNLQVDTDNPTVCGVLDGPTRHRIQENNRLVQEILRTKMMPLNGEHQATLGMAKDMVRMLEVLIFDLGENNDSRRDVVQACREIYMKSIRLLNPEGLQEGRDSRSKSRSRSPHPTRAAES